MTLPSLIVVHPPAVNIDDLAIEQALIAHANDIDLDPDDAVAVNRAALPTEAMRRCFKHAFVRHARNIAEGNPFYGLESKGETR